MDVHHLVEMANQIGTFYSVEPDRAQALQDTASHIRRFWDPRMRSALYGHLDQHSGEGIDPFVVEAITLHRTEVEPATPKEQARR